MMSHLRCIGPEDGVECEVLVRSVPPGRLVPPRLGQSDGAAEDVDVDDVGVVSRSLLLAERANADDHLDVVTTASGAIAIASAAAAAVLSGHFALAVCHRMRVCCTEKEMLRTFVLGTVLSPSRSPYFNQLSRCTYAYNSVSFFPPPSNFPP